jgi:hypothetical protein
MRVQGHPRVESREEVFAVRDVLDHVHAVETCAGGPTAAHLPRRDAGAVEGGTQARGETEYAVSLGHGSTLGGTTDTAASRRHPRSTHLVDPRRRIVSVNPFLSPSMPVGRSEVVGVSFADIR